MAKELLFKGKTVEELKSMSMKELIEIMPARVKRTLKRGFNDQQKILLDVLKQAREGKFKKNVETHCRNMVVLPEMLGQIIYVHNGKEFVPVAIIIEMLGHYLGEFAQTRKKVQHSAPGIGATRSSAAVSVK